MEKSNEICLRRDTKEVAKTHKYIYTVYMLLSGAKKAITRKWLQINATTIEDWQMTVQGIYSMVKLTFVLRLHNFRNSAPNGQDTQEHGDLNC